MNTVLAFGIGLLVVVAAVFMILWILDARRADHVAADPERVQGNTHRRRWSSSRPRRN